MDFDLIYAQFHIDQFLRYWLPGWLANFITMRIPDHLALKLVPPEVR